MHTFEQSDKGRDGVWVTGSKILEYWIVCALYNENFHLIVAHGNLLYSLHNVAKENNRLHSCLLLILCQCWSM